MRAWNVFVVVGLITSGLACSAQTSVITETGGNVGIGTTSPQQKLSVQGGMNIDQGNANAGSITNGLSFGSGSGEGIASARSGDNAAGLDFYTEFTKRMSITQSGRVGIGTFSPIGRLDVVSPVGGLIVSGMNLDPAWGYLDINQVKNSAALVTGWNRIGGNGEADFLANRGGGTVGGFAFFDVTNDGIVNHLLRLQGNGNVGIGTTNPGAKLDVAGSVKISGSGASMTFPDNTVQSTAWNGTTCGGDYAESVDVAGDHNTYEPGDVLVIDPEHEGGFLKSSEAYATGVTGVFSTKPGLTGRRQLTEKSKDEVPMAMVGIVPTKVSAENGAIRPGDLLVSSSKPGYAMRGTDRSRMLGAVIGKALGHLDKDTGVIEVVILMQ